MPHIINLKIPKDACVEHLTEDLQKEGIDACFTLSASTPFSEYMMGPIIGSGGFSTVRATRCLKTGEEMAIKIISKAQHAGSMKRIRRLKDEMRVLASLRHPNIISLVSIYENESDLFLVMERAHGGELFDRIVSRGQFTESEASTVARGLFSALAHLHTHGIMHRDVKPENLLLQHPLGWEVKLSDFGLVGVLERQWNQSCPVNTVSPYQCESEAETDELDLVADIQTLCGSSYYIAPEISLRERYHCFLIDRWNQDMYDVKVDMWSAGVVLYIMLCGSPPFENSPALISNWQIPFHDSWGWDAVSSAAKDLISALLIMAPTSRLDAQACLNHPWIQSIDGTEHTKQCLSPKYPTKIQKFNEKRKRSKGITPTNAAQQDQQPLQKYVKSNMSSALGSLSLGANPVSFSSDTSDTESSSQSESTFGSLKTAETCGSSSADSVEDSVQGLKPGDGILEIESIFQEQDAWTQTGLQFQFSPANHVLSSWDEGVEVAGTNVVDTEMGGMCEFNKMNPPLEYDTLSSDED